MTSAAPDASGLPIVEDQTAAIDCLSSAANWPYPDEGPIRRVDTHGAVVFLGRQHVFKLKRAVRFPYMDFSTLARRLACCEAELSLNRRTAPEIYLGLRPLVRNVLGRIEIGGQGPAIDWVVEMRRFDDNLLFEHLAERNELTIRHAEGAARILADLHRNAERRSDHGGIEVMARTIAVNAEQLRRSGGGFVDATRIDDLERLSLDRLRTLGPLIEKRRQGGFVRRVHGDAHLGNLCLSDGRPILFDCIEFNDDFAVIDMAYDLAFLLMDLCHRGLVRHANAALNAWLEQTGDYDALALFPLFLSARAMIRAHVSASMSHVQSDDAGRSRLQQAACAYFDQAQACLEPGVPVLVGVGGLSGSGKSQLALMLAPELGRCPGAVVLRSDVIRKELHSVAPTDPLPQAAYAPEVTRKVYDILCTRAGDALRSGRSVIVDAVHAKPDERSRLANVAAAANLPFIGLWLDAPMALRANRVDGRTGDASDADRRVVEQQSKINPGAMDWQVIDASGEAQATLHRVKPFVAALTRA